MGEIEATCTDYRTEDGGTVRYEAALSSLRPYYLSWYRLVFPPRIPSRDDEQLVMESEQR